MFDKGCVSGRGYVAVKCKLWKVVYCVWQGVPFWPLLWKLRKLRYFDEDGFRTSHIVTRFVPGDIVFDKVCVSGFRYVAVLSKLRKVVYFDQMGYEPIRARWPVGQLGVVGSRMFALLVTGVSLLLASFSFLLPTLGIFYIYYLFSFVYLAVVFHPRTSCGCVDWIKFYKQRRFEIKGFHYSFFFRCNKRRMVSIFTMGCMFRS